MSEANQDNTILIVDDDTAIGQMIAIMLSGIAKTELALSGREAFQRLDDKKIDLIILDVQMPKMNGFEVCERLKENKDTAHIPIVFLTADNSTESEERGLDVGAIDFIRKPISHKILLSRVSNVLKLQDATRRLEQLALTDPLTGAFNRRYFMEIGNNELMRSKRYSHAMTALMLDIDHFKNVNDTYGHDIGDTALINTVSAIEGELRIEDTLGRFGGEEFVVLLPETEIKKCHSLAERIKVAISSIIVETPMDPLRFTISIGMSEFRKDDTDINDILIRADQALYRAKNAGRNCVSE